ncbi:interleukin-1 receptor-associated kinase 1 isoform X1 [Hypomesus transpacificus]|uniref:interleukin-1 receptor-associated kinase 1 isoform X1 n=2 Tax=Hypomesus transpacificus TaxID=137520 RepID=UPI001F08444E|nr:interleukin-1 receptor-associated kinase 1 isoform X1 [Hypomesus transpacificus]
MTSWDIRKENLHKLSSSVMSDFTRLMDTLPNTEWVRFASRVLSDQTDMRLAERRERRTDWIIVQWGMRNGTVGDLLDILDEQQLYRPRDIILSWRPSGHQLQPPYFTPSPLPRPNPPDSFSRFTPPPKIVHDRTQPISQTGDSGLKVLPTPGPPPWELKSESLPVEHPQPMAPVSYVLSNAMCWPFEEVQHGTDNFSVARLIGEGGFGHVYHASMRNTDYAVKKLKEDSPMDWNIVKESFRTEVEKLSRYRHTNIVELMGYSIGGGTYCLLYTFMPHRSLEDQLQNTGSAALSWPQRVSVMRGTAKAIQFLHSCSPALIHGDIKSSNILLGEHLEAKLGDFGLARFCSAPGRSAGKTTMVARTKTVRGTLAYLPDEFIKSGELGVGIDIYSFGVVLLEVLTGRRALELDCQSKAVYLKDLVLEAEDDGCLTKGKSSLDLSLPPAATRIWKNHLDLRLKAECEPSGTPGPGAWPAGLPGSLDLAGLACCCLAPRKKRRPPMNEVFQKLKEVHTSVKASSSGASFSHHFTPPTSCPSVPKQPISTVSLPVSTWALTQDMSKLGPLEDTYDCHPAPASLPPPPPPPHSASSFLGPCESDESQGYTQYNPLQTSSSSSRDGEANCGQGGPSACYSPAGSLYSNTDTAMYNREVEINHFKQRFLHKLELHHEGRIDTDELLSSNNLYLDMDQQQRGPEESDELAYLSGEACESPANTSTKRMDKQTEQKTT